MLEIRDRLTHRGLRQIESLGSAAEPARFDDSVKTANLVALDLHGTTRQRSLGDADRGIRGYASLPHGDRDAFRAGADAEHDGDFFVLRRRGLKTTDRNEPEGVRVLRRCRVATKQPDFHLALIFDQYEIAARHARHGATLL